ncbi:MAG TPA: peptide chain release factor-like protein [Deltaproteobacteria bacterium]|nr:peptide chain release factor-like protein [Deltaproteobacteria bacterium]
MSTGFIGPEKIRDLEETMRRLGIHDRDIQERFVLAGGRGGQKVNKTASCVHLTHVPTGIEVKCSKTRSQAMNRFFARRVLALKIEEKLLGKDSEEARQRSRIRKQKKKRAHRAQEKQGPVPGKQ